ncbi:MAG TPA: DNRLRE domain-containing protein, partial [Planctomycetota bacterium]|nr:DNRLRE domain-containing protein [Planctomycetota bacterium]
MKPMQYQPARSLLRGLLALTACLTVLVAAFSLGCGEPAPALGPVKPSAAEVPATPAPVPATTSGPIKAGSVELQPVADTSIASYPAGVRGPAYKDSEQSFNYGKSTRIKIKRQENMALLKFDFSKVPAGATITSAEIVVTMENGKAFNHMGVYSMHVDWNEGEGTGNGNDTDKPQTEAETGACFLGPKGLKSKWREYADSDFSHAAAGN